MNNKGNEILRLATTSEGVRGLTVEILKPASYGDSSAGGVSSKHNTVFMVCPQGNILAHETDNPKFKLIERNGYFSAVECDSYGNEIRNPSKSRMFGGCFVYTSDSRFRQQVAAYPVPMHDRWEG